MTEYLTTPDGVIAYDTAGAGPLIVCAPGMGDIRQAYRHLTPLLVEAGYRVATLDLRGHGDSGGEWPSYSQVSIGRDLLALVNHLGPDAAAVIGHSFTPDSAIVAAVEGGRSVERVVLVAPWATTPRMNPVMAALQGLVLKVPTLWAAFYASLYPGLKPADFREHLAAVKASAKRNTGLPHYGEPAAKDAVEYRARLTQPALVVMGTKDPDFSAPLAEATTMKDAVGGPADVVMIEGAGHYPHAQYPRETADAILAFLRR
jgi:pimeloyl-ACP methyl ester carboxylesterase